VTCIGFDWHALPRGSLVVDVGGGIGSTSMLLASAFSSHGEDSPSLRFIIQDRPIVVEMGEKVGMLILSLPHSHPRTGLEGQVSRVS